MVTHGFLQTDCQVNHGHVGGGDTEGHAGQLAVKYRVGKSHRKFTGFSASHVHTIT